MDETSTDRADGRPAGHKPRRAPLKSNRVLVKEVNWLGDLVLSLPALRTIRATFSNAKLSVLVAENLVGFFDGIGWVDEVIPYRRGPGVRGFKDIFRIVGEVRARRFDLAILFPRSFQAALWVALAGIPRRAGYVGDGRSLMLTHRATPTPDALAGHQTYYWLGMLRDALGIADGCPAEDATLEAGTQNLSAMRAWLGAKCVNPETPLVAIAPAAAYGPAKEWPLIGYARLIDLLAERHGAQCVLVGAPSERGRCQQVATAARAGAIVAAGETNVGELIALLSLCDGFAGNDSGAMHLAAALGMPTVGIFGSTNPARTGPSGPRAAIIYHRLECSPCLDRTCRFGHYQCLRQVSPEEVAGALAQLGTFATAQHRVRTAE